MNKLTFNFKAVLGSSWKFAQAGIVGVLLTLTMLTPAVVSAIATDNVDKTEEAADSLSLVPLRCVDKVGGCNICEVTLIFTNAANLMAFAISSLALIMFIIGGFMLIVSAGNQQRIDTGRKILVGTVMGIIVVFMAWFLVNFIVRTAYYSNHGQDYQAHTGAPDQDTVNIFRSQWWAQPKCVSPYSTCAERFVGSACEAGACTSDSCICTRSLNEKGDDGLCKEDTGDFDAAKSDAGDKKICACQATCTGISAFQPEKVYSCVNQSTVTDETVTIDLPCNINGQVCIKPSDDS